MKCRVCKVPCHLVLDLGIHAVTGFLSQDETMPSAPLHLVQCEQCHLVQLDNTVAPDIMFKHFWYKSGISSTIRNDLADIVKDGTAETRTKTGEYVCDIGSNDGTLLSFYPEEIVTVGFEPSQQALNSTGDYVLQYYFSSDRWHTVIGKPAQIVTTISMFYDIDDPVAFSKDIATILDKNGVWINQMNYLPSMLEADCYDNIVHEHLTYYSLTTLCNVLSRIGLEAYKVKLNRINGGSFRVFIGHEKRHQIDSSIKNVLDSESSLGLDSDAVYEEFRERTERNRDSLCNILNNIHGSGAIVHGLGASTRGNTILQYCRINAALLPYIVDANPAKWGKRTVGSNIPVSSKKNLPTPDYYLVLPYHLLAEFQVQETKWLDNGGKFIVPLPEARIVGGKI